MSKIQDSVRVMLEELGVDSDDENFKETPERYERAIKEFIWPKEKREKELDKIFKKVFKDEYNEVVVCGPIYSTTLCPHHLVPVKLKTIIGYLPNGVCIGASKLVRLVDICSHDLILQEKLTRVIADTLMKRLELKGCAVTVTGSHDCMTTRGVKQEKVVFRNRALRGVFLEDTPIRMEFLFDSLFTMMEGKM